MAFGRLAAEEVHQAARQQDSENVLQISYGSLEPGGKMTFIQRIE